jgi:hypothetical protein
MEKAGSNSCDGEGEARGGDIKRHLSKRRSSAVDSEAPADTESRRSSLSEEAALLDGMLLERMKGQRRKSSLGILKLPDLPEGEVLVEILEENNNRPRIPSMKRDNRRELWRKAGPPPEIPRPPPSSSSSSEDEESSSEDDGKCVNRTVMCCYCERRI